MAIGLERRARQIGANRSYFAGQPWQSESLNEHFEKIAGEQPPDRCGV